MKNTYSASRANTEENNDIVRDGANNIWLERRMQYAGYIDSTNKKGTDLELGRTTLK